MKNLSKTLLTSALTAMVALGWSCKDPNPAPTPTPTPEVEPKLEVKLVVNPDKTMAATSAAFEILPTGLESYVYKVEEGENKPSPDPTMLYAEAKEIHKLSDKKESVFIYGLEATKKYTVHFAFKIAGKTKYMSKSLSTTMPQYDRLINVVLADRRELKVQFNAPEGQYFRYAIMDKVKYHGLRGFGAGDYDLVGFGEILKGPQVVTQTDGTVMVDPMTGEEFEFIIKPFTTFVVLYAECDSLGEIKIELAGGGEPGGGGGMDPLMIGSSNKPNIRDYTTVCTDDWYSFVDKYAKTELVSAAAIVGAGEFTVTGTPTEYSATFAVTPPPSVKRYGAAIFPKSELTDNVYPVVGVDGSFSYILDYLTIPVVGAQNIYAKNLQKDTTYVLTLIGVCDETGDTQIIYSKEFKTIESTQPAVEIVLTQVEDVEKSPYFISFNVKAPNKDCHSGLYLMNYTKAWVNMIKDPVTYASFTLENGVPLTEKEIESINSADGLVMRFPSWEDTENLLSITSFNQGEKSKNFTIKGRSLAEPAKARVESPLFTDLLGTWNVSYTGPVGTLANKEYKFKTTIAGAPEEASATFAPGDKQYNALHKFFKNQAMAKGMSDAEATAHATERIATEFEGYKVATAKYAQKYRDQNRLVMRGFAYNAYAGVPYLSPWDLFCKTNYNSYDNDQLFYDYGSKLFLEVKKVDGKDVLTLETNAATIAPFSNYTYNSFIAGAIELSGSIITSTCSFPVEIVDANTLKIKHTIKKDGKDLPFMTAYTGNGSAYSLHTYATADIVLTRAAAPAAAPASYYSLPANDVNYERPSFDFKRTSLSKSVVNRKTTEVDADKRIDMSKFEKIAKKIKK